MSAFEGKTVLLGVSGGIAAYKAAMIASSLVQSGARVEVILTESACRFITPLTFSAITHAPVHIDPFTAWGPDFSGHVTLAQQADLLIAAPATAMTIARLALGLTDDLIGLVALSTLAPILVAPAMEDQMYRHSATQDHLATIASRGVTIVGPETGRLASGRTGTGRMAEPSSILAAAEHLLSGTRLLDGKRVVVTAGGTREPIDPVRYIGNRSSGKMGYAIAEASLREGARVTLITGPTSLSAPAGVSIVAIETALEMQRAVEAATRDADLLIMAAAVADFRPVARSEQKIKKSAGVDHLDVRLTRNPDILAGLDRPGLVKIGFAAETERLVENAERKLRDKGLAMIVANDAEATIGSPESAATLLFPGQSAESLPRMTKEALARVIVRRAASLLERPGQQGS
jgi:phosphopantothenoylcysteine decarboxylase/phosphopantothenate--cysteine ligase